MKSVKNFRKLTLFVLIEILKLALPALPRLKNFLKKMALPKKIEFQKLKTAYALRPPMGKKGLESSSFDLSNRENLSYYSPFTPGLYFTAAKPSIFKNSLVPVI